MNVTIELSNASGSKAVPLRRDFRLWAMAAMNSLTADSPESSRRRCKLSIRIVDETESADLNSRYRHKQGPTNILSFPVTEGLPVALVGDLLGDLAICAAVVEREASAQQKQATAHWAHMTVHGVLHLNGYDHEERSAAHDMETLETTILAQLGFDDPYQ